MTRLIAVILFCAGIFCLAAEPPVGQSHAQVPMTGAGLGAPSSGGGGFTGPGDVVSGALAWWSPYACYNSAYVGNVADIWDATGTTTETLITCTAGGVIHETINPLSTTCAVSCFVATLYDQIGTHCSGSCDLTEAISLRPVLALNVLNSKPCVQFSAISGHILASPTFTSASQPITLSTVAKSINNSTQQGLFFSGTGVVVFGYNDSGTNANTALMFAGASADFSATDATFHAIQAIFNSASSIGVTDGSATTGLNPGSTAMSGALNLGGVGGSQPFDGNVCEFGAWPIAFSSGQYGSMNSNQHSRWAF